MPFDRAPLHCYVCNRVIAQNERGRRIGHYLNNENSELIEQIAKERRDQLGFEILGVDQSTRVCFGCFAAITEQIQLLRVQDDPNVVIFNVVKGKGERRCIFCGALNDVRRLSLPCRVNVYMKRNIFIPDGFRSCGQHLNEDDFILDEELVTLQSIRRPVRISAAALLPFLEELRNLANPTFQRYTNEADFTAEDFNSVSPITKEQFQELFSYCDPVPATNGVRHIYKKDLLMFLCKMRQGLSDDFLKVIFKYPSRQAANIAVSSVRVSLVTRFVQENIGFRSITRNDFIQSHVTAFCNELYNQQPDQLKAIVYVDGTYTYTDRSANFRILRQSFSIHKYSHLIKPELFVASDGYILAIQGPYFADHSNNDAKMLQHGFETDPDMDAWFQNGDIMILDRGYRDVIQYLERKGITGRMPNLLDRSKKQFSTEEANDSRLITTTRWVVEARNGHIKTMFKFLGNSVSIPHLHYLNDFYNIAGAIINRYHPLILRENFNARYARKLLDRSRDSNVVQALVEEDNLVARNGQWIRLGERDVPDFPVLSLPFLADLTASKFQLNLAPSYVQDKIQNHEEEEFQLDTHIGMPGFIRVRVYSRFRNNTKHQIFVAYQSSEELEEQNEDDRILGYYCTCRSGARTLGCCAHVASVIWFLGFARHQEGVKYPSASLLPVVLDAAERPPQRNDL